MRLARQCEHREKVYVFKTSKITGPFHVLKTNFSHQTSFIWLYHTIWAGVWCWVILVMSSVVLLSCLTTIDIVTYWVSCVTLMNFITTINIFLLCQPVILLELVSVFTPRHCWPWIWCPALDLVQARYQVTPPSGHHTSPNIKYTNSF